MSLQRDVAPASEPPLTERYRNAVNASQWQEAAVLLNGFSDADIQTRVNDLTELPPLARKQMRLNTPEWAHRVRRPLLILDFQDAKGAGQWDEAVVLLNGFNEADIRLIASQLAPEEATPMVHAALHALSGVSQARVLSGAAHRYDEVSPDPPGTKAMTVITTMKKAGAPQAAIAAYVELKLGVRFRREPSTTEARANEDTQTLAAAMQGNTAKSAGGASGAPKPLPPEQLEDGNLAHQLIGDIYCAANPASVYDFSVFDILRFAKGVKGLPKALREAKTDIFTNFDMRPDIADLRRQQIFEIKPAGSIPLAVSEALLYVELFNSLRLPEINFTLGHPGNPGTYGMIPGPDRVLVWASPLPGAIGYAFVRPPESPARVQERIRSGAYERGNNLGPQGIITMGMAAVAASALVPEVSVALAGSYESLLAALTAAARSIGQTVPEFAYK